MKAATVSEIYKILKSHETELGQETLQFLYLLEKTLYGYLSVDEIESLLNGVV